MSELQPQVEQQVQVITDLSVKDLVDLQQTMGNKILVIKFSAQWCKPCKIIKPTWDYWIRNNKQNNIIYADIDIDESMDLYVAFKKYKMIKGVPTIFRFAGNVKREQWFIPDDSFSGGDIEQFKLFLNRCVLSAQRV